MAGKGLGWGVGGRVLTHARAGGGRHPSFDPEQLRGGKQNEAWCELPRLPSECASSSIIVDLLSHAM